MFWPFLVADTAISLALTKLGALLVLCAILSATLKIVSILLIATVLAAGIYLMRQKYRKE
jgi:hypothetical protein